MVKASKLSNMLKSLKAKLTSKLIDGSLEWLLLLCANTYNANVKFINKIDDTKEAKGSLIETLQRIFDVKPEVEYLLKIQKEKRWQK